MKFRNRLTNGFINIKDVEKYLSFSLYNFNSARTPNSSIPILTMTNNKLLRECNNEDWEKTGLVNKYEKDQIIYDYSNNINSFLN
jgi:hypothetical protein